MICITGVSYLAGNNYVQKVLYRSHNWSHCSNGVVRVINVLSCEEILLLPRNYDIEMYLLTSDL